MLKMAAILLLSLGISASALAQGGKGGNTSQNSPSGNNPSPSSPGGPSSSPGNPPGGGGGQGGGFSIEAEILAYKSLESDSEVIACDVSGFLMTPQVKGISPNGPNGGTQGKSKEISLTPVAANCSGLTTSLTQGQLTGGKIVTAQASQKPDTNGTTSVELRNATISEATLVNVTVNGTQPSGVVILSSSGTTLASFQVWRMNMALMKQLITRASAYHCPKKLADGTLGVPALDAATEAVALIQSTLGLFASNASASGVQGTIQDQALMDAVARQLRGLNVPVLMPDAYAPYSLGGLDFKNSPFLASLGNLMVCRLCLQSLLRDPSLQVSKTDIDNLTAQRKTLADQVDADQKAVNSGKLTGKALDDKNAEIGTLKTKILSTDDDIKKATSTLAQVNDITSLISTIDSYVGSLTGNGASPGGANTQNNNANNGPGSSPQSANGPGNSPQNNSPGPPSGGTPPIATVLAADGLAQEIGVQEDGSLKPDSAWQHVLLLKALESGGSLITHSNILGSKVFFTGGAVATYALFTTKGHLSCSGNVFDYGGYLRAEKFNEAFRNPDINPTRQLVLLRGGCSLPE
jgi:hypothetical protein